MGVKKCCKMIAARKDLALYIIFMLCFCLASWMDRGDETAYYMTRLMKDDLLTSTWRIGTTSYVYKTFYDIANIGETYSFLEEVFLPFTLQESYENGDPIPHDYLYYPHNCKLLGIRLRVVRVQEGCVDTGLGDLVSKPCRPAFDESLSETGAYGDPTDPFKWDDENAQLENSYWGKLNVYTGAGYFIDMPLNYTLASERLAQARKFSFYDDAVRAFFIDFQLYNEPHNLHMVCRMVIEFPHGGGARPKATFNVLTINKYQDLAGNIQMAMEMLIGLFTIYFFLEEGLEMKSMGLKNYMKSFWNVIDLINIFIFASVGIMRIYFQLALSDKDPIILYPEYVSLQLRVNAFALESALMSVNAWLLWFKLLKFMSSNPKFAFLTNTFIRAAWELVFFSIIFFFLMIGFGHAGYVCFNATSFQFRSFEISFITIFLATTGGLDVEEISADNVITGSFFVFLFELSMVVILVNVFLAIINSAYDEVSEEARVLQQEHGIENVAGFLYELLEKARSKCKCLRGKGSKVAPTSEKAQTNKKLSGTAELLAMSTDEMLSARTKEQLAEEVKDLVSKKDQKYKQKIIELRKLEQKLKAMLKTTSATLEQLD